ncbi:MAG: isocyanide synthase family protein [Bdellovibrionota bacterium]
MKHTGINLINHQNPTVTDPKKGEVFGHLSTIVTAKKILSEVMKFRRVPGIGESCSSSDCQECMSLHLPKIVSAIQKGNPISFVLPAFPGKSPNLEKVLGPLPDYAERLSLRFLANLSRNIKKYYSPGAKIILCSDGRVFSDVIGMRESNVTAYQDELSRIIEETSIVEVSTFNLDDCFVDVDFVDMRYKLMNYYGNSLEYLKNKVRNGTNFSATPEEQEANRMYRGITRFLFEDSMYSGQKKSRSAIQRESKTKAYEVIRRSNAWSELIAERFPEAVRLSIHPQTCGSKKIGIRLIGNENWMTPWHGVAVETDLGFSLLKRYEAEALGAELVYSRNGRPSHYKLKAGKSIGVEEAEHEL